MTLQSLHPPSSVLVSSHWPQVDRPDVGAIFVSEWTVGTPDRQRATAAAFADALQHAQWPEGALSVTLYASTDGTTVLIYGQWTSEEAYAKFFASNRQIMRDYVDRAVPGIERRPPVSYRIYRSGVREKVVVPGCVVIVSVEFDGPDEQRQQRWVDTVFEALEAEPVLPSGGISGHFHISTDGTRVLNYAEWTDEEAHRNALLRSGQNAIGSGPKWNEVRNFPGVVSNGFKRYRLLNQLTSRQPAQQGCFVPIDAKS
jgi:heme-degrading monooxygenase HmoA